MATYRECDKEVYALVKEVMKDWHPELIELAVKVKCLFAYAPKDENTGEPKGPALRHHGWPAAAIVKVTSHKDRVAGLADAVLSIDGLAWEKDWSDGQKVALIDHECSHLEVISDEDGHPKLDDCGRPRLRIRPHDAELGVFFDIAERHGEAAFETRNFVEIHKKFTQMKFPWG